ncbi:MAG: L-lactate dehydrogenase [Bacilli bacterium]|nr:L-lactate dehydrogenase [Bacilli bacterium]
MNKIVIVGSGNVGNSYAYSLLNQNTRVDEIILIDLDSKKALGNAMDLSHTLLFSTSKIKVKAGSYIDAKDARIVVIAAGANQKPNETRLELINKNNIIIKQIVSKILSSGFNGIFLVATNPVDIMCYLVKKYSKFQSGKIIGSGTILDTSRLAFLLSDKLNVDYSDIHAYVLGEHGDTSFIPWSNSKVGPINIQDIIPKDELNQIENKVRRLAYKIIDLKGETSYGIGVCLAKITNAILNDENAVLPVSVLYDKMYLSMPAVINKNGVKGVMKVKLTLEEKEKLEKSKNVLKQIIMNLEE